jgi:hypothetical protein
VTGVVRVSIALIVFDEEHFLMEIKYIFNSRELSHEFGV